MAAWRFKSYPQGHWIDARSAFYVVGSSRKGSMEPTVASFGAEADAKTFSAQYGGKVLRLAWRSRRRCTQGPAAQPT
ncbi:nitrous oxide reductase accessory protein NosL [Propionivibrio sp.]|uniref:nitrous oxide reductase accessory protein NosL n=1 Tax=Propionivibrio sp. TaxID=2212460 RepID=UPI0026269C76|nr:nitrous oxide reductase accessory protein NosL [Propionivibrio sp.]